MKLKFKNNNYFLKSEDQKVLRKKHLKDHISQNQKKKALKKS